MNKVTYFDIEMVLSELSEEFAKKCNTYHVPTAVSCYLNYFVSDMVSCTDIEKINSTCHDMLTRIKMLDIAEVITSRATEGLTYLICFNHGRLQALFEMMDD